jgi:hypothetical protein
MKELFGFLQWQWQRQEPWQKLWIVAMFFMGMGLSAEGWAKIVIMSVPVTIFGFYIVKWVFWDTVRSSWLKYKEHRNQLLTTIRSSHEEKI